MLLANLCWVLAYDTEYAMVDRDDDLKIGIKTSAITFGRADVAAVMASYCAYIALWAAVGWALQLSWPYFLGVAAAAGSACHTGALNSSHVLDAMGCDARRAQCAMRFSWSRMNTMDETVRAADIVIACVNKMRSLRGGDSPVLVSS